MMSKHKTLWIGALLFASGLPNGLSAQICVNGSDLQVSSNGHYLVKNTGAPFFFLSDTEWVLNLRSDTDIATIMDDRKSKGFTVIQVFATRDFQVNGSGDISHDVNGNLPFAGAATDPSQLNDPYWNRWRSIADMAATRGLHLLLIYGEPNKNGPRWACSSLAQCYSYARQVGAKFSDKSNVLFGAGQDADATAFQDYTRALAEGVADGTNGINNFDGAANYATSIITYHGTNTQAYQSDSWLDFYGAEVFGNIAGIYADVNSRYTLTSPTKPSMLLEGDYEGFAYPDVTGNPYWSRVQVYHVFGAGGSGYGYGNNDNYKSPAVVTLGYLSSGGADGMHVFSTFMQARNWWKFVPDQAAIASPGTGATRIVASQSTDGDECLVYYPTVTTATINMGCITARSSVVATWFDPRNGNMQNAGTFTPAQQIALTPPSGWEDAMLDLKGQ